MSYKRKTDNEFGIAIRVRAHRRLPTAKQYAAACEAFRKALGADNATYTTGLYVGTKRLEAEADQWQRDFESVKMQRPRR